MAVALNGTTNHNAAVTVTNADYTAAELATINNGTSGAITLNTTDTALSGTAANLAAAFAGTVTEHTGTVTITDAPSVTELKTINAGTTGAITLNVTNGALSGTSSDLVLAFAGDVTEHTGTVTITNADYTLSQLITINSATTGAITLNTNNTALSGNSADYSSALAGTINYVGNITISNADYTVTQLANINNGTTGSITLNTASTDLSGSSSDLAAAFAGTVTEHTGAITITNADYTVAELKTINAGTTGAITLNTTDTALSGTSSDLALAFAGTVTEHTGTVGITNADYSVAELKTINAASTGAITFTTATTALSDTSSNLAVALNGTTNHNAAVTVTNADYTAAELATINNGTAGAITLNTTNTALSGTAASLAAAFAGTVTEHTGTVTITDAPSVSQLKTINAATTGAITLDVTNGALSGTAADLVLAFAGTVTTHTGTVTITDAPNVTQLKTINAATSGAITWR